MPDKRSQGFDFLFDNERKKRLDIYIPVSLTMSVLCKDIFCLLSKFEHITHKT